MRPLNILLFILSLSFAHSSFAGPAKSVQELFTAMKAIEITKPGWSKEVRTVKEMIPPLPGHSYDPPEYKYAEAVIFTRRISVNDTFKDIGEMNTYLLPAAMRDAQPGFRFKLAGNVGLSGWLREKMFIVEKLFKQALENSRVPYEATENIAEFDVRFDNEEHFLRFLNSLDEAAETYGQTANEGIHAPQAAGQDRLRF